jgi:hypothetical protein
MLGDSSDLTEDTLVEIFELWRAAASTGNPLAQRSLAQCYLEGQGCDPDPTEAMEWFAAAAEQGEAEAEYQLGRCYRKGYGVQKDSSKARFWLERASAKGHNSAGALLRGR